MMQMKNGGDVMSTKKNKKKKNTTGKLVGTTNTVVGVLAIVALFLSCVIMNGSGAVYGGSAGLGSLLITIFFILFWSIFPVIYKDNTVISKLCYILCLLMCMAAACGLVLKFTQNGGFLSAALVSIVAVPFYGLRFFLGWTATYGVATATTLWWMLYTGAHVRTMKPDNTKRMKKY